MLVDSKRQKPGNDPSNNSVLSVSKERITALHIFLQTPPYFMIPVDSIAQIEAKEFSFVKDCSS